MRLKPNHNQAEQASCQPAIPAIPGLTRWVNIGVLWTTYGLSIGVIVLLLLIVIVIGWTAWPATQAPTLTLFLPEQVELIDGEVGNLPAAQRDQIPVTGDVLWSKDGSAMLLVGPKASMVQHYRRRVGQLLNELTAGELRMGLLKTRLAGMSMREKMDKNALGLSEARIAHMTPSELDAALGNLEWTIIQVQTRDLQTGQSVLVARVESTDGNHKPLVEVTRQVKTPIVEGSAMKIGGGRNKMGTQSQRWPAVVVSTSDKRAVLLVKPSAKMVNAVEKLIASKTAMSSKVVDQKLMAIEAASLYPYEVGPLRIDGKDMTDLQAMSKAAYDKWLADHQKDILANHQPALREAANWSIVETDQAGLMPGDKLYVALNGLPVYGWRMLFGWKWDPTRDIYGLMPQMLGTVYTSLLALIVATVFGVAIAIYLSQDFLPTAWELSIKNVVDLLAAIPSVVYGLWGIYVVIPVIQNYFDWVPGVSTAFKGAGVLPAVLVLAIMVLPTIAAISREALVSVNPRIKEAAYGMGCTRWEAILFVMIPTALTGIFGAIVLGFGRALGETMALAMLLGNNNTFNFSIFATGNTLAALIANNLAEADGNQRQVLMVAGLLLLLITLVVNMCGAGVVQFANRNRKGAVQ